MDWKFAFSETEKWGWYLDTGDVDGDGTDEVIVTKRNGGNSSAAVLSYDTTAKDVVELFTYNVYGESSTGGMHVEVGDVDGDNKEEVVHVPVVGAANVQVFGTNSGNTKMAKEAGGFALQETFTAGSTIEVGDVTGDGNSDVIVYPGPGGGPNLRVYTATNGKITLHSWLMTYDAGVRDGGTAVALDMNEDGDKEVVVVPVGERPVNTRIYDFTTAALDSSNKPDLVDWFWAFPESWRIHANISW